MGFFTHSLQIVRFQIDTPTSMFPAVYPHQSKYHVSQVH